jgi:hypothetical protein
MERALQRTASAGVVLVALVQAALAAAGPTVVPWLPLRPAKAPANPPPAPPCRAGDLRTRLFLQGATGSLVGGVDFRNAGPSSCSLVGHPTVSLVGAAAAQEKWHAHLLAASPAPPDVLADPPGSLRALAPGKSASVALFWSNWCGPGATPTGSPGTPPDALTFGLASGTTVVVPLTAAPRCDAPQDPSTLSVGPFTPTERHLPESSRLPLRVAIIGNRPVRIKPGLRAFRVHRGDQLRYDVAVTNTSAQPFRFASTSCPGYIEQFATEPGQVYVLNCRAVRTIAAGQTVLFAMQLRVPADARLGNNSLTWELAPKTYDAPFASAALWVVP